MAATGGTEHPDLNAAGAVRNALQEVERELRENPGEFEFFQAVRLLIRLAEDREGVGRFVAPEREAVRFSVNPSLSFPPSQVHGIDWSAGVPNGIPKMIVNFMGLTGPLGNLPYAYSDLINERLRNRDRGLSDFFDIFNHRAISLFYQAWEKYRFAVAFERDGSDRVSRMLASLMGLGTQGLENRMDDVADEALVFYTGLLGLQPRSAAGLRNILEDYFGVPVEVEQFVGSWQSLAPSDQCAVGSLDFSEQLGIGVVAGDAIWDRQSRIRLKLGPLDQHQYLDFLPTGSGWRRLRAIATFYCGAQIEIEVQLILKQQEVPRCELGDRSAGGPRLGWFTWMKSGAEFNRSPGDSILLLT